MGPAVMGWLREGTNSYSAGLLVLAAALLIEAVLIMSLKLPGSGHSQRSRRREAGSSELVEASRQLQLPAASLAAATKPARLS